MTHALTMNFCILVVLISLKTGKFDDFLKCQIINELVDHGRVTYHPMWPTIKVLIASLVCLWFFKNKSQVVCRHCRDFE